MIGWRSIYLVSFCDTLLKLGIMGLHMRVFFWVLFAFCLQAGVLSVPASAAANAQPFEIVKNSVDVELSADGSYVQTSEVVYRLLTEAAVQSFRQTVLSYTQGYQDLNIKSAYTLKPNGTKYEVPQDQMLRGYGANTSPGFEDLKTIQVIFSNLEVGDEVGLITVFRQIRPWFGNQFAEDFVFSPTVVTRDGSISITAPSSVALQIDNLGLNQNAPEVVGDKVTRSWTYRNDDAVLAEEGAVSPLDTGPRLLVSTFTDAAQIAALYRGMMHGKADVDTDVKSQADQIVAGISDRREQARTLYEWVSTHIGYVDIVLGAGGFVPHSAVEILHTHYGDCKDHVVVLTALLAAEGIVSQPVLIDAGNRFQMPKVASPFIFNHMINYLPEFQMYVDSTARYAPFGELPLPDADKPVLNVMTGMSDRTPSEAAVQSRIRTVITATISRDGAADGDTKITVSGNPAMTYRALFQLLNQSNEAMMFQKFLGPGGSGTFDKGNVDALTESYAFGAHFHQENAVNMPGPGAISPQIGFRTIAFTPLVGGDLPPFRANPYVCESLSVNEDITLKFPAGVRFTSLPPSQTLRADGVVLSLDVERLDQDTLHSVTTLVLDHPHLTCSADYYAQVRPKLAEMVSALRSEVIYRMQNETGK